MTSSSHGSQKWHLMKHEDNTVFGPMGIDQLRQWAADACISPLDKVSADAQATWVKAPMVPELQMDYILETGPGYYYGPTTVGAVREFLAAGEITHDTLVTNCTTGEEKILGDFPIFFPLEVTPEPQRLNIRTSLQTRIRELEEAILEERRLRNIAETMRAKAETRVACLEKLLNQE